MFDPLSVFSTVLFMVAAATAGPRQRPTMR
jgi:hypothetical protein